MKYLLLLTLALGGCATLDEPVDPLIPVRVPCKEEEPNQPTYRYTPPYDNVFDGVRDLLGDREIALAYENQLRTALRGCK